MISLLAGEKQSHETDKAILACNDYLRMGAGRSLDKLTERYRSAINAPPTKRRKTLADWSRNYGWVDRAATYDATWEERKNAEREAEFNDGLANDFERVRSLKKLANHLEGQIYEDDKLWLPDVKSIGSGDNAERVDIVRFNAALVSEYRATLDDLAKETGGRVKKTDLTSDGKPLPILITKMDVDEL